MSQTLEFEAAPFTPAELDSVGLVWDSRLNRLLDPETGEAISLTPVVDAATAKAATYNVFVQEQAAQRLANEIKHLQNLKKKREARKQFFIDYYRESMRAYALKTLPEGRKTLRLTYGETGFRKAADSFKVSDPQAVAAWCSEHGAPEAVTITFDRPPADVLKGLIDLDGKTITIRTTELPPNKDEIPGLVKEVGEDEFFIR